MDAGDAEDLGTNGTDVPRPPLSFLFAAAIFLFTCFFYNYGVTVERSRGVALVKECRFWEIDNLLGGVLMLLIVAAYVFGNPRTVRKDLFHSAIYSMVGIGGLYLVYTTYKAWPLDCYNEVPYLIEYFIPF